MSVNRVETRFTGSNAEFMRAADQVDRKIDQIQGKVTMMDRGLSTGFRAAGALGLAATFNQVYDSLGRVIDRYNVLHGLDQGALFFNSIKQSEMLAKGLGDVAVKAETVSQTIRLMNANAGLNLGNYQQLGEFSRGLMLTGETRSVQEGLHAAEIFVTGAQSRMLHRLGINVETAKGYRDYARDIGVPVMDLSGAERMESRLSQLLANKAFQNTAAFGANSEATKFQGISAFIKNVDDSRIRSLAGSLEELIKPLTKIQGMDDAKIGQVIAAIQPGATLGVASLAARASFLNPMQDRAIQFQQLRAQTEHLQTGAAERAARISNRIYEDKQAWNTQRQAAGVFTTPGGAVFGPGVGMGNFTDAGRGARLKEQLNAALAAEGGYASRIPDIDKQHAQLNRSIAMTNTALVALPVVIGVAAAAWTAYTSAVSGAADQQKRIVEAGGSAGRLGAQLTPQMQQFQQGQLTPDEMGSIAVQQAGLMPEDAQAFLEWLKNSPGASPEQQTRQLAHLGARRVVISGSSNMQGDIRREWLLKTNTFGTMQRGWWNPNKFSEDVGVEQERRERLAYNEALREQLRVYGLETTSLQAGERSEDLTKYDAFKDKFGKSEEDFELQRRLLQQMGVSSDLQDEASTGHMRSQYGAILGFDYGELRGDDRTQFLGRREDAMRGNISLDMADEEKKRLDKLRQEIEQKNKEIESVREGIETMDKGNAARTRLAQMQDEALGANKRLLDVTNEEQSKRANASAVLSQYEQLLTRGNQELIKEFEAHHDVQGALKVLADASIDMAGKMRQAAQQIIGGIPGSLTTQAGYLSAQVGAQGTLYGAMASGNPYIEKSIGIDTNLAQLGPQVGDLVQQKQLLLQMQYLTGKIGIDQLPPAIARNPDGIGLYLQGFRDLSPDAQMLAMAEQQRKVTGLRSSLATGIAGNIGAVAQFGASLQDMQNTPENRKKVEEFMRHGSIGATSQEAAYQLMFAEREGLINSQAINDFRSFMPGMDWSAKGYDSWITGQTQDVGYMADKELQLITSMDDLRSAVDRNTTALSGSFTERLGLPANVRHADALDEAGWIDPAATATPEGIPASGYNGPPPIATGGAEAFMFTHPFSADTINSGYGYRTHPISGKWRLHDGADYKVAGGSDVNAFAPGKVKFADMAGEGSGYKGYGNIVVVDYGGGLELGYGHLDKIANGLRPGDKVKPGQFLGDVGSTGWSTGNHLHMLAKLNGKSVDPASLVGQTFPGYEGAASATVVPVVVVNAAEIAGVKGAAERIGASAASGVARVHAAMSGGIIPVANQVVGTDTTIAGGSPDMTNIEMIGWGGNDVPFADPSGFKNRYQYPPGEAPASQGFEQEYYYKYYGGGLGGGGG